MRATEIIRGILDVIDQIDVTSAPVEVATMVDPVSADHGDDVNRFRQIFDLLNLEYGQMYDNSPAEVVSGIESVTTCAGGGLNGPKNPADIRSDSVSMYPNYQAK